MKQFKTTVKHPQKVETGWIIVRKGSVELEYFSIFHFLDKQGNLIETSYTWSSDIADAFRGARKLDAVLLRDMLDLNGHIEEFK
jgi:hypothetical protein